MATSKQLERVFMNGTTALADVNPRLSVDEIRDIYSNQYPELLSATIQGPSIKDGKAVYTFSKSLGTKG